MHQALEQLGRHEDAEEDLKRARGASSFSAPHYISAVLLACFLCRSLAGEAHCNRSGRIEFEADEGCAGAGG